MNTSFTVTVLQAVVAGAAVIVLLILGFILGGRRGIRALRQRLLALGSRLGAQSLDREPRKVEEALGFVEHATESAAVAVAESSAEAIRLRRVLDTLPQAVIVRNEHGESVFRNARALSLMGNRHTDALAAQAVEELLATTAPGMSEERTLELYGPPRTTLAVRTQSIDNGQRALGVIAVIDDVSERRRLEEIRRDFVANVSHELKTPMGALGLLAETLLAETEPEVAQRLAQRIHTEAFRISRIIDDLLDLSRIESEESPPREPVLVNLVMAEAAERVRAAAEQRDVGVKLDEPSPPVAVLGDRRQLTSAIYNLLENAVKFSYQGETVFCSGKIEGDEIVIAVMDQGVGIPVRDLERIFERFYRVDHGRSRETGGTGLGLAIVRHVAQNHHGTVHVESRGGRNDVLAAAASAGKARRMTHEEKPSQRDGSTNVAVKTGELIRVLLAEDEESFIDALLVGLEREGFAVSVARDGVDALEQFIKEPPDLVLLDVMLPKLSGLDVCREIRARSSAVPIIMVTARSTEIDTVVGLEVGADDYVAKPYRLRELVSRMRAVLRRIPRDDESGVRKPLPASDPTRPAQVPRDLSTNVLETAEIKLDLDRHECHVRGEEITLPLKEFELLEQLMMHAGRVVTRDILIDRIWGADYVGDTKTLDVHIKRLRGRIEKNPSKPALITTIRGLGYRLEAPRNR